MSGMMSLLTLCHTSSDTCLHGVAGIHGTTKGVPNNTGRLFWLTTKYCSIKNYIRTWSELFQELGVFSILVNYTVLAKAPQYVFICCVLVKGKSCVHRFTTYFFVKMKYRKKPSTHFSK